MTELLTRRIAEGWLDTGCPDCLTIQTRYGLHGVFWNFRFQPTADITQLMEHPDTFIAQYKAREAFCREVSYAVPCSEALNMIAGAGPVIEGGAGTGFWAALVEVHGGDVLACDIGGQHYSQPVGRYFPVETCSADEFVARHPDRNLLLVWPSLGETWATEAVMRMQPGRMLFLVSEGQGGAVGDDSLFETLDKDFEETGYVEIPQWRGIHDHLSVWRKKTEG